MRRRVGFRILGFQRFELEHGVSKAHNDNIGILVHCQVFKPKYEVIYKQNNKSYRMKNCRGKKKD